MRGVFVLCSFAIGCSGGLPDLPRDAGGDGEPDAPISDASDASTKCNPVSPFGGPVLVSGTSLGTGFDYAPTLTTDQLQLFYTSTGGDASFAVHLYYATRPTLASSFATSSLLAVNGTSNDSDPVLTADGLTLYFQTDRDDGLGDIYFSTRTSTQAQFTTAAPVLFVNVPGSDDTQPAVDADGTLWLASDRPGGMGKLDLFHAELADAGFFATPAPEAQLNSPDDDWSPALSADGLQMFFASKRAGGMGGDDIYVATRDSIGSPFGAPALVTELATTNNELPHWVSPDKCRLYLSRSTGNAYAIYVATRGP